jgi:hypothetical protein
MFGVFGPIDNPFSVLSPGNYTGSSGEGLIIILSNLVRLAMVLAGIYTLINIILAGYGFLSAGGDPKMIQKSQERIWRSVLGLMIIVGSLVIAAIVGWVIYGSSNWDILINPKIFTP